jgi:hypothetical protein
MPTYIINELFPDNDVPYYTEKIENIIFFNKKKYVLINKGDLKLTGFPIVKC